MLDFRVDKELCLECGLCAEVCPLGIIAMDDGHLWITNEELCIKCQQCLAVCPTGALSISGNSPEKSSPLKDNFPEPEYMAVLIKGRRSVRKYKQEDLSTQTIRELLDTVWHAPTGKNSQQVLATVVDNLQAVDALRNEVYGRLAEAKKSASLPDKPEMKLLGWAVRQWEESGKDIIFRGAPHFLVSSASSSSPSPTADTHIFLAYFELMAQTIGLGTCWNGMLKWCIDSIFPDLRIRLGIPEEHEIGYVLLFGKPAINFQRTVERGKANINFVSI